MEDSNHAVAVALSTVVFGISSLFFVLLLLACSVGYCGPSALMPFYMTVLGMIGSSVAGFWMLLDKGRAGKPNPQA